MNTRPYRPYMYWSPWEKKQFEEKNQTSLKNLQKKQREKERLKQLERFPEKLYDYIMYQQSIGNNPRLTLTQAEIFKREIEKKRIRDLYASNWEDSETISQAVERGLSPSQIKSVLNKKNTASQSGQEDASSDSKKRVIASKPAGKFKTIFSLANSPTYEQVLEIFDKSRKTGLPLEYVVNAKPTPLTRNQAMHNYRMGRRKTGRY